ncbi:MAG: DUF3303 family protein [Acidimicrobiales bacterium]|nr:DUF3303 family protein [Acidimicrobiales bacterium]
MKELYVTAYRFHSDLDREDFEELTKLFAELGSTPGTIAHYMAIGGGRGFVISEAISDDQRAKAFELNVRYARFMEFEVHPVVTIEEAFPVILQVYGS